MKIPVQVHLSEFSLRALGGEGDLAADLERAIRVYLSDRGASKPGWVHPPDRRMSKTAELELMLDEGVWRALAEEAAAQEVSVSGLAGHAVLYCAAELDAGRATQRILDGIEAEVRER